jgi:sirohydrochlorin ferrochelatase
MRRSGRHRSPHRISVAPDAPALVIAVPHSASATSAEVARRIAETTSASCPGVDIRIGFLNGWVEPLGAALEFPQSGQPSAAPRAVVVPLLAGPHLTIDGQLETAVGAAWAPVMLAAHLGPHPLLAEALHDRLAEAGLARPIRARGLNVASGANGVLVIADRGPVAASEAGVTAVLLAARLTVPTAPASLGDPASIDAALARLRQAGATHLAIAPCLIGPESRHEEISELSAVTGAPAAAPLGAHPAIAQLVAIRYGEALAQLTTASS